MAQDDEKSPFNVWWVLSGALVLIVIIAAVVIVVLSGHGSDEAESGGDSAASGNAKTAGGASDCHVPAGDQEKPDASPKTTWKLYNQQMKVPTSGQYGPMEQSGKFWRCYAHSPKGAVFAGAGLLTDFSVGLVKESAASSDARESVFSDQSDASGDNPLSDILGFRIEDYSGTKATVSYLATADEDKGSLTARLVWDKSAQDWRLDLSDGEPDTGFDVDPAGFVTWGHHGE